MSQPPFFLGLPMWSNRDWLGGLFPQHASSKDFLHHYSGAFNTVEGNTTFYALPGEETVASWQAQLNPGFRFCFKFPKTITHGGHLSNSDALQQFFERLGVLKASLGPFMIQLPASFCPSRLAELGRFLRSLPQGYSYAVEVRHPTFFTKGDEERELNRLLMDLAIDRVCFDSRSLFSRPARNEEERDAQAKKPRLPVHAIATGQFPMIRFIGLGDMACDEEYLIPWQHKLREWLSAGKQPYFFMHSPSNREVPLLAKSFHDSFQDLPGWYPLKIEAQTDQLDIF
ncbi:DUF72 domain-containing protein [Thalassotalea sp. G20_0]|uniref:DUF72 domain-containing protein n=1 Tax=Thalassotalea sp. G20_0 TaxID=2821093 RepID=UPI001ADD54AD|nr:DUF72 domain-containing protein [Thalassotalea sp. G20_0]MBO9492542.1 DUF72 domain-containing protein [Thalassotalea sp. G20_0]